MPSPNGVRVKLDKSRTLRYTNRSLVMLEDESGMSATELMERVSAGSMKAVNQLIWAGLLHADPGLELYDVYDMVDVSRLGEIAEAVGEAVESAFGSVEEEEEHESSGKAEAAAEKS